jgi:cation-transporting ATPase E
VFLDGKFSNIPLVLAEGRRVVANVERVSRLFLTKTVWAFAISISFGALLWSYPYLPRQLTAMDAYAIGIPAFLLALLPNTDLYRSGFLKRAVRFVLPAGVLAAAGVIALTALVRNDGTWSGDQAHTATMILLSVTSLWVLALHSTPINLQRVAILTGMLALCAALFTVPWVGGFFGFVPLETSKLLVVLAIGFAVNACVTVTWRLFKTSGQTLR